jgi:putative membrane protein
MVGSARLPDPHVRTEDRLPAAALAVALAAVIVSGVAPWDRATWLMEVAPILIAVPVLLATHRRFRFTPLVYALLALHACILAVGGHYTYARVPLGFWFANALGLARNHYDRLGHLAQGFVPALVVREVLLRATPLRPGGWIFFLVSSVALAISASYEFVEWAAALLLGQGADAFLGTQGDPWDTQWDMFLALVGSIAAQLFLARVQDRQIARQAGPGAGEPGRRAA